MTFRTSVVCSNHSATKAIFKVHVSDHPTGVRKVTGSIPVGDSDFFFVPCYARDMLIA